MDAPTSEIHRRISEYFTHIKVDQTCQTGLIVASNNADPHDILALSIYNPHSSIGMGRNYAGLTAYKNVEIVSKIKKLDPVHKIEVESALLSYPEGKKLVDFSPFNHFNRKISPQVTDTGCVIWSNSTEAILIGVFNKVNRTEQTINFKHPDSDYHIDSNSESIGMGKCILENNIDRLTTMKNNMNSAFVFNDQGKMIGFAVSIEINISIKTYYKVTLRYHIPSSWYEFQ